MKGIINGIPVSKVPTGFSQDYSCQSNGQDRLGFHSLCIQGLLVLSLFFPFLNHPSGSTRATYYFRDILFCLLLVEKFCMQIASCAVSKVHKVAWEE